MSEPTLPGAVDGAELPPAAEPPPPRKRGRRTNAEYEAMGKTPPPPSGAAGRRTSKAAAPGRRAGRGGPSGRRGAAEYTKAADDVLGLIQAVAGMRDPVAAEIIGDGRPNLARAIGKFAAGNDLVSAFLDRLGTSSDALDMVIAAGAIALPLAAHYGVLRNTPFAGSAEPYRARVAERAAAAEAARFAADEPSEYLAATG